MDTITKNLKTLIHSLLFIGLIGGLFCLGQAVPAEAEVIFEDNFDGYADWSSSTVYGQNEYWPATANLIFGGPGSTSKKGWLSYRADKENLIGNPTFQLNSANARSGKSLKATYEGGSAVQGGGVDLWIGDPGINQNKSGYDELYIRAYFKFDPNWNGTSGNYYQKLIRLYTGKAPDYLASGVWPSSEWDNTGTTGICQNIYLMLQKDGNGLYRPGFTIRSANDPTKGGYACINTNVGVPASIAINSIMNDGFVMQLYIKLNTVGYANGIAKIWINNNDPNNPNWETTGLIIRTTADRKFNLLVPLDNLQGYSSNPRAEQYLALDDLVVSTSFVGPDYVIGGLTGDVNGDKVVDILDLQLCVNVFLGTETDPGFIQRAKEVAEPKDECNVLDVQAIVNIILGS